MNYILLQMFIPSETRPFCRTSREKTLQNAQVQPFNRNGLAARATTLALSNSKRLGNLYYRFITFPWSLRAHLRQRVRDVQIGGNKTKNA